MKGVKEEIEGEKLVGWGGGREILIVKKQTSLVY